ncbi:MAG: DHA2 family efflux MFS transporter permease subunit [Actinomycetota bacterium]
MNRIQRGTLIATGLGLFMIFLDNLIVNVALPEIQAEFGGGESAIQWVVTTYAIGMAVLMMSAATIADSRGRRWLYEASITTFVIASVCCGLAPSILVLNVSRGAQGLAAAAVNVASLALVSAAFQDANGKAKAIGIWTAIASCGMALGPTIGGILTEFVGWRSVFFVNVPVGIAVLVLSRRFVAESKDPSEQGTDVPGQLLYIVAAGSFAWAIIQGPQTGWTSPSILAGVALFVVGLIAFIFWELRTPEPMMDVRLFGNRTYSVAIVTLFVALFSGYGMLLMLTQYWQNVVGYSVLITGLLIVPFSFWQIVLAPLVGGWVVRTGSRVLVLVGLGALVVGLVTTIAGITINYALVVFGVSVVGLGFAFTMTPTTAMAMSSVSEDRAGMASGIMSSQRAIGSMAGFAVLGTVLASWLGGTLDERLSTVIPDAQAREIAVEEIIDSANPRAYSTAIVPSNQIEGSTTSIDDEVVNAAKLDFREGIQLALGLAAALTAIVLALCWRWLPKKEELAAEEAASSRATRSPPLNQ